MEFAILSLAAILMTVQPVSTAPIDDGDPCSCELSLDLIVGGSEVDPQAPGYGCTCLFGFSNLTWTPAPCLPEPGCLFIPLSECTVNFGSIWWQCGILKVIVAVDHDMETTCGGRIRSTFECPTNPNITMAYELVCARDCEPAGGE